MHCITQCTVFLVEVAGFEPAAFWSRTKRATKLRYTSKSAISAFKQRWLRGANASIDIPLVELKPDLRCGSSHALKARAEPHEKRANRGTRTLDLLITSELLYHLSHIGMR